MFGLQTKKIRQNNRGDDAGDEISVDVYLDPDYLVERLSRVLSKETNDASGHVHIHFRNKSDHIILTWSEGKLGKILAKSTSCKKGQYVHWGSSQFCDYEPEDVLRELYNEIEHIHIDSKKFNKTWLSYTEFIRWLIEN